MARSFRCRCSWSRSKTSSTAPRRAFTFRGIVDRIKFICTAYDPGAGRYRIDIGLVFGSVIAAFSLLVMGGLILREWFRSAHA